MADGSLPDPVSAGRSFDPLRLWRRRSGGSRLELVLRALPAVLYMGLIFLASSVEGKDLPPGIDDRAAHFTEYLLFAVVLMVAVAGFADRHVGNRHFASAWGFAVLYGASDEFHQAFVPGRSPSFRDLGFDALGISCGLLALHLLLARGREE